MQHFLFMEPAGPVKQAYKRPIF